MTGSRPSTGKSYRPVPVFSIGAPAPPPGQDNTSVIGEDYHHIDPDSIPRPGSAKPNRTHHQPQLHSPREVKPEIVSQTSDGSTKIRAPPKSGAILKIKATMTAKEIKAREYAKQYTTSPYAPLSASVPKHKTGILEQIKVKGSSPTGSPPGSPKAAAKLQLIEGEITTPLAALTSHLHPINHDSSYHPEPPVKPYPTGAQYSGFYAKLRSNYISRQQVIPPSIGDMVKIASTRRPKTVPIEKLSQPQRPSSAGNTLASIKPASVPVTPNDNFLRPQSAGVGRQSVARGRNAGRNQQPHNMELDTDDILAIESHLAKLTDSDPLHERVSEATSALTKLLSEKPEAAVAKALFEAGAVSILLHMIPKALAWPEVEASICILLKAVTSENPNAMSILIKEDGLSLLLKAADISSKMSMDLKDKLERTGSNGAIIGRPSAHHHSISSSGPLISIEESSSPHRNSSLDEHALRSRIGDHGLGALMEEPPGFVEGFLAKLSDERYPEYLERLDSRRRAESIRTLLDVFQKLDGLISMSNIMSLEMDIDFAAQRMMEEAQKVTDADQVSMFLVSKETGDLYAYGNGVRLADIERDAIFAHRFPARFGIVGEAASSGVVINLRDPVHHELFRPQIDSKDMNEPLEAMLAAPIVTGGDVVVGVLVVQNKKPGSVRMFFDEEDEYLIKMLATTVGTIIGNAKVYDAMQQTQKKVEVLLETTRSLGSILDINVLCQKIMDSAKELLVADRCTLFLNDVDHKKLKAIIPGRDGTFQEIRIPYNAGIAGYVFTSGDPINITDAYKDARFNPEVDRQTGYVTRNILCMPLKNIHSECIGVTQMINKKNGVFSVEDEMILSSFSAQAAVAIEKSQLFTKTEDMRIYLQSILSSITSCVITLSETQKLQTVNHEWFEEVLGTTEEFMRENPIEKWLPSENHHLFSDIQEVYKTRQTVYSTEYELKGRKSVIVNYQVMPLIGVKGVVIVLDDISVEKRAVMTLGRYMSPELAKQVMEDNGQLGGKRKKVSILFSDIRSFTTLSEGMEPTEVVEMLNHHFTDAVNAITEEHGILDKFIGDAVMAVFGVPFAGPDDAIHACTTALKMKEYLVISNKQRVENGKRTIKIGIGINTGMVLSGNIGSTKRMEFSCIGDAVNLASRVEGLTKPYGITIMITEYTLAETNDRFITRELEPIVVTGKKIPVKMYELVARKEDKLSEKVIAGLAEYSKGHPLYMSRRFAEAFEHFQKAVEISDDGPSKVLANRCKQFIENPPPDDWTGVHIAEGK